MGKGARDSDGNRVHGTIVMGQANRKTVKQSFYDFEVEPDLEVLVEKLPESLPKKRVDVLALIDEQGQIQECAPATEEDVRLGGVACVQAKQHTLGIKLSEEGTPVRYITTVAIDFLVQESQMTAET